MNILNEKYRQKSKDRPLEDVLADFHASYQQIVTIVGGIPEAEMLRLGVYDWTKKLPLIAWIAANTCEHYKWATRMIHPRSIKRKMSTTTNP
jgi:hypothetical protein